MESMVDVRDVCDDAEVGASCETRSACEEDADVPKQGVNEVEGVEKSSASVSADSEGEHFGTAVDVGIAQPITLAALKAILLAFGAAGDRGNMVSIRGYPLTRGEAAARLIPIRAGVPVPSPRVFIPGDLGAPGRGALGNPSLILPFPTIIGLAIVRDASGDLVKPRRRRPGRTIVNRFDGLPEPVAWSSSGGIFSAPALDLPLDLRSLATPLAPLTPLPAFTSPGTPSPFGIFPIAPSKVDWTSQSTGRTRFHSLNTCATHVSASPSTW